MTTTSIRRPDDLKQRMTQAAEHAGQTPHAFMLEAIAERVAAEERRRDFHALAEQRYARIVNSGETIPWPALRDYLKRRLAGEALARPKPVQRSAD